jgi:ATP-binding protein involved in chromosome partitioning
MRKVAVQSVKGGVGKSTVSAGLCYALRDLGQQVGYLELDISGTSGHRAFGLDPQSMPRLGLKTETSQLVPPTIQGIKMYPLAMKFTEDFSVAWRESDQNILLSGGDTAINTGRRGFIQETLTRGVDWGELDWLVIDLPPSTGQDVMNFYAYIEDLFGVLLISQPSEIAVVGLKKTIDFLKTEERPIIGLVENMGRVLCPHCRKEFYPFTSRGVDLHKLADKEGIPFLVSIPQVDSMERLQPYFAELSRKIMGAKPKVFRQDVFSGRRRLVRDLQGVALKTVARIIPRL